MSTITSPNGVEHPTCCGALIEDFPRLADAFEERERLGWERYGQPLDPFVDDRDFEAEAGEEVADAMVYVEARLRQLEESKRVDPEAMHRWLTLRQARRTLARVMLDLRDESP